MNTLPTRDFLLSARPQYLDEPDETAILYTGVLSVRLDKMTDVVFVPHTRRDVLPWPPVLPPNTDIIQTPEEARRVALCRTPYAVTPDAEMAGQEELVPYSGDLLPEEEYERPMLPGVIFYTTLEEYETLWDEVLLLANRASDFRRGIASSELAGTALLDFLLRRVIASNSFNPIHRRHFLS